MYEGPFANRLDADHVTRPLPDLGGPDKALPVFIEAVEFWAPDKGGLILSGPTGSGKTTAVLHLIRRHLATREDATSTAFMLAADLVDDPSLIDKAKRVRLLVLDDVGKEHDPKNVLFRVLDYRFTRVPTIVTTGLSVDDLNRSYDGAFVRRLGEFKGSKSRIVTTFPPAKVRPRPPSDQDEQARRLGERAS
jgi:DNA replication protein DnaC